MEMINTDYKRRILKIEAKLFIMRKPWLSSFNVGIVQTTVLQHDKFVPPTPSEFESNST